MKIIVLGRTGLVSSRIEKLYGSSERFDIEFIGRDQLDAYSDTPEKILGLFEKWSDEELVVINTIAITDANICEDYPEQCMRVNAGIYNVLAKVPNIKHMVHISTDAVFSGISNDTIYTPYDIVEPTDVYSHSKIIAEDLVKGRFSNYTIIRCVPIGHRPFSGSKRHLFDWVSDEIHNDTSFNVHGHINSKHSYVSVHNLVHFIFQSVIANPCNEIVHVKDFDFTTFDLIEAIYSVYCDMELVNKTFTIIPTVKNYGVNRRFSVSNSYLQFKRHCKLNVDLTPYDIVKRFCIEYADNNG